MAVRRRRLLQGGAGLAVGWALAGCGGSADRPQAALRLVNASGSTDVDLFAGDTRLVAALAPDAASGYAGVAADRYTLKLRAAGSGTTAWSASASLAEDVAYAVVAYRGTASALRGFVLAEDVGAPPAGTARLRVLNLAPDAAAAVDVYLGAASAPIGSSTAVASNVAAEALGGVAEVDAGSYRLRVTEAGRIRDLRLDLPTVTLEAGTTVTLVLTTAAGGMLVDALLLTQRGAAQAARNGSARVRVAAGVAGQPVALALDGQPLVVAQAARTVTGYVLVPAGTVTPTLSVGGVPVAADPLALAAGGDITLLVHGDAAAPRLVLLAEDNRGSPSEGEALLRVVHGLAGGQTLSLSVDATVAGDGVGPGAAQEPVAVASGTHALAVSEGSAVLYSAAEAVLNSGQVYTLFMLGDRAAPLGLLAPSR